MQATGLLTGFRPHDRVTKEKLSTNNRSRQNLRRLPHDRPGALRIKPRESTRNLRMSGIRIEDAGSITGPLSYCEEQPPHRFE